MYHHEFRVVLEELKARWEQKLHDSDVFDAAEGELLGADDARCPAASVLKSALTLYLAEGMTPLT